MRVYIVVAWLAPFGPLLTPTLKAGLDRISQHSIVMRRSRVYPRYLNGSVCGLIRASL
jgi:hypothetical protein